jgi:sporulation integral membrane protein YlbJ
VPGIGGFAVALGFASGYPVGAKLTSQLWEQRLISRVEGERLVSFITTSDPIFLIGAVSVGFFHDATLAVVLGAAHYGTALLVGIGMRFYGGQASQEKTDAAVVAIVPVSSGTHPRRSALVRAFYAMHEARIADGRPIGTLLSHAVGNALQLNFVVGGLVVFFSVVLAAFTSAGVMGLLHTAIGSVLQLFGLPQALSLAIANGLFEVTLGAQASAIGPDLPLAGKVAIAAFVLSWGGLSVHAQIVSILSHTPLRYAPFLAARFTHAVLAAIAVLVLWSPLQPLRGAAAGAAAAIAADTAQRASWTWALPAGALLLALLLAALLAAAFVASVLRRLAGTRT